MGHYCHSHEMITMYKVTQNIPLFNDTDIHCKFITRNNYSSPSHQETSLVHGRASSSPLEFPDCK